MKKYRKIKNETGENEKTCLKEGFSMVETIVVISILSITIMAGLLMMSDGKNKLTLDDAQANISVALEMARNKASTGFGAPETDHGVNIDVSENTITPCHTVGAICIDEPEKKIDLDEKGISIIDPFSDLTIIFNRLSGTSDLAINTDITIKNNLNGKISTITVTPEGIIEK